jgi:hypothetical protein
LLQLISLSNLLSFRLRISVFAKIKRRGRDAEVNSPNVYHVDIRCPRPRKYPALVCTSVYIEVYEAIATVISDLVFV